MVIPKIYRYYPRVPLAELSDLYSPGNNTLAGKKIAIVSHLPKTLRINAEFAFNNLYTLFVEDTAEVDSIAWTYKLYKMGSSFRAKDFAIEGGATTNEYSLYFLNELFPFDDDEFVYDTLRVTCTVEKGANKVELSVEHTLIRMLDVRKTGLFTGTQSMPFTGSPTTTNYIMNHLADYFTQPGLKFNEQLIHPDFSGENTLIRIVLSLIYYNLSTSSNQVWDPILFYDITEYNNTEIQSCINDGKPYNGGFTNGLCRLPLHVLNKVIGFSNTVPDYSNVTANMIYNLIKFDPVLKIEGIEDDLLQVVPVTIEELKTDLISDEARFAELYHLSLFPKSAIKLTAVMINFLFECSRANQCRDCKNRFVTWPLLNLDGLKDNQDFLRNILTHYHNGPANTITDFALKANKITQLTWTPVIHTLLNIQPRIVKAYFARKVVTQTPAGDHVFSFERLDSSMTYYDADGNELIPSNFDVQLGRQVYLVVETLQSRGKELIVNIKPTNAVLTGNTNNLEVLRDVNFVTDLNVFVGKFDDLKNNDNVLGPGQTEKWFPIDNADRAIIKLSIRPATRAQFNVWTANLATNVATLELKVRRTDNTPAYFGNNITGTLTEGEFLNANDRYYTFERFRVINQIVYETYAVGNRNKQRKNNSANFVDRIGRIENDYVNNIGDGDVNANFRKVSFYYHDEVDNLYFITECPLFKPRRRDNGVNIAANSAIGNIPPGWVSMAPAPVGGDAFENYYYATGRIVTRDNPAGVAPDYGVVGYEEESDPLILNNPRFGFWASIVRMPDNIDIKFKVNGTNKQIKYGFFNTQRRFAFHGCFAALIGVLAETNLEVESTGMCFQDATSFPSISHPNGDSIDLRYNGDHTAAATPAELAERAKDVLLADTFRAWFFSQIVCGNHQLAWLAGHVNANNAAHNDHLHSGNFDRNGNLVQVINE